MKTLKSQLLKKLQIEFYETQDLSSTHGKPKLLFYDYSCNFFFLQPIAEGNCEVCQIKLGAFSNFVAFSKYFDIKGKKGSYYLLKMKIGNKKVTIRTNISGRLDQNFQTIKTKLTEDELKLFEVKWNLTASNPIYQFEKFPRSYTKI